MFIALTKMLNAVFQEGSNHIIHYSCHWHYTFNFLCKIYTSKLVCCMIPYVIAEA